MSILVLIHTGQLDTQNHRSQICLEPGPGPLGISSPIYPANDLLVRGPRDPTPEESLTPQDTAMQLLTAGSAGELQAHPAQDPSPVVLSSQMGLRLPNCEDKESLKFRAHVTSRPSMSQEWHLRQSWSQSYSQEALVR